MNEAGSKPGGPGPRIYISIDYGTKTLAVAYRVATAGEPALSDSIKDVTFRGRGDAPQKIVISGDGRFYWGHDAEVALRKGEAIAEDMIELIKLLLYKDHVNQDIYQDLETDLEDRNLDLTHLIAEHLRHILQHTKEQVKIQMNGHYTKEDVDTFPIHLFLSVPQMWKAPANRIMTHAAKRAGVKYVELVYEPQCATAYYTQNIKGVLPTKFQIGDELLVADIGGGTGDFVLYRYQSGSEAGASVQLQLIGTEGSLCGSEFVNRRFLCWMREETVKKAGSFERMHKELGLTPCGILRQAVDAFEKHKIEFTSPDEGDMIITIRGAYKGKRAPKRKHWVFHLPATQMASFFEDSIAEIKACVERQLTPNTKAMIIPGGFGRSVYLLDYLREHFGGRLEITGQCVGSVGTFQPVARGALLRYETTDVRGIASSESFGIGRTEKWDPILHPDATKSDGSKDEKKVEQDENDPSTWNVYERWKPMLKHGDHKKPGESYTSEIWQQHHLKPSEKQISVQVYWTEADVAAHSPIFNGANIITGTMKSEFDQWGPPLEMGLPNLRTTGFELIKSANGSCYEIFSRLQLIGKGANISVKWQIAKPGTQPFDAEGNFDPSITPQFIGNKVYSLSEEEFNTTVRDGNK